MKSTTATKLWELGQAEWFHAVGQGQIPNARMVSSWIEAVVNCAGGKWQTVQYDAVYLHKLAVYDAICGLSPEQQHERDLDAIRAEMAQGGFIESGPYLQFAFPQWDRIREEIKPTVVALVTEKTKPVVLAAGLPDVVVQRATWDILYMAMETEFAEVLPGTFFGALALVYRDGHFPCGWEGDWPDGQLLLY